jgi:hypothetical protein
MLCCALGIAAVATVPAWRRFLLSAAGQFRVQVTTIAAFSIFTTAIVGIVAAHSFFHESGPAKAMSLSHLCVAPSLRTADFRAPDRVAQPRRSPTF